MTDLRGTRVAVANWRDPWHPQAGGAERYAWEMARGLTARYPPSRLVWVGRLVAHKRAELILPVARRGFEIDVIGRGPAMSALAEAMGETPAGVRLHGFLTDDDKRDVVAGSLLHLNTSQGEGWGLCVLAGAAEFSGAAESSGTTGPP